MLNVSALKCVVTEVVLFSNVAFKTDIVHGSVATHLRCTRIFSGSIIANGLLVLTVKKFLKIGQCLCEKLVIYTGWLKAISHYHESSLNRIKTRH